MPSFAARLPLAAYSPPCVRASPEDVRKLQDVIEREPATSITLDLAAGTLESGELRVKISMPPKAREALVSGTWDTTGLLLDRYDEVDTASKRLPYVAGF